MKRDSLSDGLFFSSLSRECLATGTESMAVSIAGSWIESMLVSEISTVSLTEYEAEAVSVGADGAGISVNTTSPGTTLLDRTGLGRTFVVVAG